MENMLANSNYNNFDMSKLSDEQIQQFKEQLKQEEFNRFKKETQKNFQEDRNEITSIKNDSKKKDVVLEEHKAKIDEQERELNKTKKIINVIGFGPNSKKWDNLRGICRSRVYRLLGEKSSVDFIVWQSYFFKKIYADIANHFEVSGCKNINVDDFEESKQLGYNWLPEDWYLKKKLDEMKDARDMGQLKPERCMALTMYLQNTNNGEINPFC